MSDDKGSVAGRALRRVFHAVNTSSENYRNSLQDFLNKNWDVNDAQVSALMDMLGSYRDIAEQLALHPVRLAGKEFELAKGHVSLLGGSLKRLLGKKPDPVAMPEDGDRRFSDPEWNDNVLFDYLKQAYLLNSKAVLDLVDTLEDSGNHTHDQFMFYTRQLVNALAPTNFFLTNPEVLRKTLSSGGGNLLEGMKNFWEDYKKNPNLLNISMTDFSAFEVGRNVATTPGKVVYQNDLMQLIQYTPTTEQVYKTPLLIIPPWINKYYILDLKEKNSLIKWIVDQGHTVFVVSWVNPGPALRDKTFESYMVEGALAAMDAVEKATGEKEMNAIGYCVGGTLLGCTLAYLAAKKQTRRIKSATYLTTLLDFTDPGGIGVFINKHAISGIEKQLDKAGYYDGRAMAFSFNMLRENDLFWSFFVNNYLKGEKPAAFDLLYWNSDSTNLPAAMHSYYLRNMYLENKLMEPGGISLMNTPIDLRKIKTPAFFLSTIQDHIAKWKSTYGGARAHSGPTQFVLSGSGHIAGVVNPPSAEKYGFWTGDQLPDDPDDWFAMAEKHKGSWWPHWSEWIQPFTGEKVAARVPGDRELGVIEDAPGTYVKQRIADVIGH
ncbi:class I poly(R)-hydroxyalkanoic acid synthase [Hahella sp. KA22]|uniref:class I poly(R)-hydroxyalkanoic acid synthase n=1 Tax=Hahella sp. KA22 TaxID=1628392 RepID=UPI000FDE670E|nr:class I poly(R)-hydroxyalkanoic acid synthase [Hahella sp. KA22]AZZ91708.1 class I poly(R)-hydroxyalkanoic acid synthase [Hahella sp. KA22]QAY55078.1 class I poly(R)-hydroxyalkanoic acid synthase [Hahella sp. KA22]